MKENSAVQKRRGLDILRGIGITGIVLYHMFPSTVRGGFLGVPLFFVLSGYLMFVTSEHSYENGEFRVLSYYKKRLRKIVPPLFTMVMVVCCYLTLTQSSLLIGIRREICSIFLGCENWWQIGQKASYFTRLTEASPFTHLWFLAVEIQFYLLWPFLFLLYQKACRAVGSRKMCFVFLLLALLSAGKMMYLYTPGADPSRVYYGTDTMAFPLFIGMFLGALRREYPDICSAAIRSRCFKTALLPFALFSLIVCVLFFTVDGQSPFLYQGGMFLLSIFFACMIHITEEWESQPEKLPESAFLSLLGRKSYNIYLWHYPLIILALV